MTFIKICGIREEAHAMAAAEAGADFIGLVFAASPRQVAPDRAEKIVAAMKKNTSGAQAVGVFVNTPADRVKQLAAACRLDWVQLSGDETWEYCLELDTPVIKAVRLSRHQKPEGIMADLEYGNKLLRQQKHIFLLDTRDRERYGGTGKTFDWETATPIAAEFPVMIAGGLTPDNVGRAIKSIRPWGVDVSSGVETGGIKDMTKIDNFIRTVRQADDDQTG